MKRLEVKHIRDNTKNFKSNEAEKAEKQTKIAIINITKIGNYIAYKIKENIKADLYSKYNIEKQKNNFLYSIVDNLNFQDKTLEKEDLNLVHKKKCFKKEDFNFKEIVKKSFQEYDALIFISSTGIAVRASAPFIQSKDKDPAVIVIDSTGKYVISLLSGHLGGANELTEKIAEILGAQPIITTATDNLNIKAPDIIAKENNLVIQDLKKAKDIAAFLVNGEKVAFIDEENLINKPKGYINNIGASKGLVFVTNKFNIEESSINKKTVLKLIRKNIVLGIGCRKNYDVSAMKENVIKVLKEENIDIKSIDSIVSVEIKKDENAIKELSKFLGCPFTTYTIEEIKKVEHKFKGSDFVRKTIGVGSVCEPSIDLKGAKIIKEKQKLNGMTLAIGKL